MSIWSHSDLFSSHCPNACVFAITPPICVPYHLSSEPVYVDGAQSLLCVPPDPSFFPEHRGKLISRPPEQWEPLTEPWPVESGQRQWMSQPCTASTWLWRRWGTALYCVIGAGLPGGWDNTQNRLFPISRLETLVLKNSWFLCLLSKPLSFE